MPEEQQQESTMAKEESEPKTDLEKKAKETTESKTGGDKKDVTKTSSNTIPLETIVKHPLQHKWTLWYCKSEKGKPWEDCLKKVTDFDTVEDFWALYNHIQLASGLSWGSDYYMFKEGIQPMWEDKRNREGGRWLIMVDKYKRNEMLDHYWLELLMAMVGEQFEDCCDHICGSVVNVRMKGDKVSLWTKDADDVEANKTVGRVLKTKLGVPQDVHIIYEKHADTSKKTSSIIRSTLRV